MDRQGIGMRLTQHQTSFQEQERILDLTRIIPKGRSSVLEIGARDGYMSKIISRFFDSTTVLDIEKPNFFDENIVKVQGDVTNLEFMDNSFDVVLCSEVLEHIPYEFLKKACSEISRVAKHEVVIGVPYEQDLRVGRTICSSCDKKNPPWGHVNVFNENILSDLFSALQKKQVTFVGETFSKTNVLSAMLMGFAGNPWGTYNQEEGCIYCDSKLTAPSDSNIFQKICTKIASKINSVQECFMSPRPIWTHMVFEKNISARLSSEGRPV
jgi:hypothetical protein